MKSHQATNQVRIIAGTWRGRRLVFAPVPGLRPTPDRVRETLFNWLVPVIRDARCLDLYAGSGALGLEAASRGAAEVVLVDKDPQVVAALGRQREMLGAHQVRVVQADVLQWLSGPPTAFDIVFLDPPFRREMLLPCIQLLERRGWLADQARVYIEAEKGLVPELPENWELLRSKAAGQVGYHLAGRSRAGNGSV
jgi:16S rRNA (guanine966-N2)-methyltransferase